MSKLKWILMLILVMLAVLAACKTEVNVQNHLNNGAGGTVSAPSDDGGGNFPSWGDDDWGEPGQGDVAGSAGVGGSGCNEELCDDFSNGGAPASENSAGSGDIAGSPGDAGSGGDNEVKEPFVVMLEKEGQPGDLLRGNLQFEPGLSAEELIAMQAKYGFETRYFLGKAGEVRASGLIEKNKTFSNQLFKTSEQLMKLFHSAASMSVYTTGTASEGEYKSVLLKAGNEAKAGKMVYLAAAVEATQDVLLKLVKNESSRLRLISYSKAIGFAPSLLAEYTQKTNTGENLKANLASAKLSNQDFIQNPQWFKYGFKLKEPLTNKVGSEFSFELKYKPKGYSKFLSGNSFTTVADIYTNIPCPYRSLYGFTHPHEMDIVAAEIINSCKTLSKIKSDQLSQLFKDAKNAAEGRILIGSLCPEKMIPGKYYFVSGIMSSNQDNGYEGTDTSCHNKALHEHLLDFAKVSIQVNDLISKTKSFEEQVEAISCPYLSELPNSLLKKVDGKRIMGRLCATTGVVAWEDGDPDGKEFDDSEVHCRDCDGDASLDNDFKLKMYGTLVLDCNDNCPNPQDCQSNECFDGGACSVKCGGKGCKIGKQPVATVCMGEYPPPNMTYTESGWVWDEVGNSNSEGTGGSAGAGGFNGGGGFGGTSSNSGGNQNAGSGGKSTCGPNPECKPGEIAEYECIYGEAEVLKCNANCKWENIVWCEDVYFKLAFLRRSCLSVKKATWGEVMPFGLISLS